MEKITAENQTEKPQWKRLPITVEVGGKKQNVWVDYIVQEEKCESLCIKCKKIETMFRESVKEVRVESDDEEIIRQATNKIVELVRKCEDAMAFCKACLPEDFEETKNSRYLKALEEAQEELDIEVNKEAQRKAVLGE